MWRWIHRIRYNQKVSTDLEELKLHRDAYSEQAIRLGTGKERPREGIVLRPLVECFVHDGEGLKRVIAKYKGPDFSETATYHEVDLESTVWLISDAQEIADEWVTNMRLSHILDKFDQAKISDTGAIIKAMAEDIRIEGKGEVVLSEMAEKEIGRKTVQLFKNWLAHQ